jgi:hypothetical protein
LPPPRAPPQQPRSGRAARSAAANRLLIPSTRGFIGTTLGGAGIVATGNVSRGYHTTALADRLQSLPARGPPTPTSSTSSSGSISRIPARRRHRRPEIQ